jgi:hypothetical protein
MRRQTLIGSLVLLTLQAAAIGVVRPVPLQYPTIQQAINASGNGDVVVVAPGVYSGPGNRDLEFNGKAITVTSQINPANPNPNTIASTIIDCQGSKRDPYRAFYFHQGETPNSKVLGFTIRNGFIRGPKGADGDPNAVSPEPREYPPVDEPDPDTTPPRAERGDDAVGDAYGGAILCEGASPTIQYCVFTNCTVAGALGGDGAAGQDATWSFQPADPNAEPVEVGDGQWGGHGGKGSGYGYGGAIACRARSSPVISDCTFTDNTARGGLGGDGGTGGNSETANRGGGGDGGDAKGDGIGGAIYAKNYSNPIVTNCTFTNNTATQGLTGTPGQPGEEGSDGDPPAVAGDQGEVIPLGTMAGGAAYFGTNSRASFTNCEFTGNKAYEVFSGGPYGIDVYFYTRGGAIYSVANNTIALAECEFTLNFGGAVYCESGCGLTCTDCLFKANSNTANGGAIYLSGGGSATLEGCTFLDNWAYSDGGAFNCKSNATFSNCIFSANKTYYGDGGAIDAYRQGGSLTLAFDNCIFSGNSAVWGGGVHFQDFQATFTDCYFLSNTAEIGGGLFLAGGTATLTSGAINGNYAAADDGFGGGLACVATQAQIRDYTIKDNLADGEGAYGGAIAFYGGYVTHEVKNCLVVNNFATASGGAISCNLFAAPQIKNSTFADNSTGLHGGAVFADWGSEPAITDCIFTNCNSRAVCEEDVGGAAIIYCLFHDNPDGDYGIWDSFTGTTDTYTGPARLNGILGNSDNRDGNPLFVTGQLGDYYLSQVAAGQSKNSPALDAGSDFADNLGLNTYTTRTDNVKEADTIVDIGYHYRDPLTLPQYQLTVTVLGGHGTAEVIKPDPISYDPITGIYTYYGGTLVTLVATPDTGYRVGIWSGGTINDASKATKNYVVMGSNRQIVVQFEQPKTIFVPTSEYPTIQHGIDAAVDGDVVMVGAGVYVPAYPFAALEILNKAITLTSTNPDDPKCIASTVLVGHMFEILDVGPDTIIQGFTVRNSNHTAPDGVNVTSEADDGPNGASIEGGVMILIQASPTIRNFVIEDSSVTAGDGAAGDNGTADHPPGFDGGWGGWAYGGAVYCTMESSPTFKNCTFRNCYARGGNGGNGGNGYQTAHGGRGGSWEWAPSIETGPGTGYWMWWDGWQYGPYDKDGNPIPVPAVPYGFYLDYWKYSGYGGAIYCELDSSPKFLDCTFDNNHTYGGDCGVGGTLWPTPDRNLDIENYGGAIYAGADCSPEFTRCIFRNNSADLSTVDSPEDVVVSFGGAVCLEEGASSKFTDCSLTTNSASLGGAIYWADNSAMTITDCNVMDNTAYHGAGLYALYSTGTITNTVFMTNRATLQPTLPGYDVMFGQGGGFACYSSLINILHSKFTQNQASASGGAIYFGGSDQDLYYAPFVHNCLIMDNVAGRDGGAISANWYSEPLISNCTVVNNRVTGLVGQTPSGGGLACGYNSHATIKNSIFWLNQAGQGSQLSVGPELIDPEISVSYSDIQYGKNAVYLAGQSSILTWGPGNIDIGPMFVNGYYLSQIVAGQAVDSPCVNTGGDTAQAVSLQRRSTRTDGAPDAGMVDMGYHYEVIRKFLSDFDFDGDVDLADLSVLLSYWLDETCITPDWCEGADLNKSARVDFTDYASLAAEYCPTDERPPQPDPSAWAPGGEPAAISMSAIRMTAATATDDSGVEYYFECTQGTAQGGNHSGWQDSATYEDTGLAVGVTYCYRAKTRDKSPNQNESGWSSTICVVVPAEAFPPTPDPSTWEAAPYEATPFKISMTATTTTDPSGGIEYFFECTSGPGNNSGWQTTKSWQGTVSADESTYCYRVRTRDLYHNETTPSEQRCVWIDHAAPQPNPSTWSIVPTADSAFSVTMTATAAADPSGVEYFFECTQGKDQGGSDSGWQDSPTFEDTGLRENTQYAYRLKTRDKSAGKNEGAWSTVAYVTTAADTTTPSPNPSTWEVAPYAVPGTYNIRMTATTAYDLSGVEYYFECTAGGGHSSAWQDSATYTDTGLAANIAYYYRVRTRDKSSNHNQTNWSSQAFGYIDFTKPQPDPSRWQTEPYQYFNSSDGLYHHRMVAVTATDASGVQYYFECFGGSGSSSWQDSPIYDIPVGVTKQYWTYKVKTRDKSTNYNETGWSLAKMVVDQ